MKMILVLSFLTMTFGSMAFADEVAHKSEILCFDISPRDLDAPFEIQYAVVKAKKGLELAVIKLHDEEGTSVLKRAPVKKYDLADKTVYRDAKNTIRLEIMKKDSMASGFSKAAKVSAKNMDCLKGEEVQF